MYTDAERDRVLAEGKDQRTPAARGRRHPALQRVWGEMELPGAIGRPPWTPEHRILKQVHIEDAAAADETFSMLMGDEGRTPPPLHPAQRQERALDRCVTESSNLPRQREVSQWT